MVFIIPVLLLIMLLVAGLVLRRASTLPACPKENRPPLTRLDKVCVVTNWILGILYLPLSLFFFLLGGMAVEGFMENITPAQSFLCTLLSILSIFPIFISEGGILASVVLRARGRSRWSFAVQFAGIAYFAIMLLLFMILYAI